MAEVLLDVRDLRTCFAGPDGPVWAVDGVSFQVPQGQTLGLLGESGCGKSATALSILRLIPAPSGRIAGGQVWFAGRELLGLPEREMRRIRGRAIAMVFQEPMTSLNPVFTVGDQILEAIRLHQRVGRAEAWRLAVEALRQVGIADAARRVHDYPHQMSGGMRQRVMIAMAVACRPALLIADEPTTALDVTIQAQILELLRRLQQELGMAVLLITHNMGVVAEMAHRVAVMYAGRVVEQADVRTLFRRPAHPYTAALLESVPKLHGPRGRLRAIEGTVPAPGRFPPGCRFHPRCPQAMEVCRTLEPPTVELEPGHQVACWLHGPAASPAGGSAAGGGPAPSGTDGGGGSRP
ncbi:MAG TPA: ABC transporter ATP-binding protein [Limnochordales bacterium]